MDYNTDISCEPEAMDYNTDISCEGKYQLMNYMNTIQVGITNVCFQLFMILFSRMTSKLR